MSMPDPAGESLESILASIRKSLSEQSTDVLEEEAPPRAPDEAAAAAPRKDGLTGRLAAAEASEADQATAAEHDTPAPVEETPPSRPAPPPVAPAAPRAQEDPLWFLSGRGQPAAQENERPATAARPASVDGKASTAAPMAAKPGVVRGPLPPFFGSSAEAQKAEVVLVQPGPPGPGVMLPPVGRVPAAAEATAADGVRNGKANSFFGRAAADDRGASEGDTPHVHALEAMVLELLRPMLQRWLDENMPRLVAAALKDEAARLAARNSKMP